MTAEISNQFPDDADSSNPTFETETNAEIIELFELDIAQINPDELPDSQCIETIMAVWQSSDVSAVTLPSRIRDDTTKDETDPWRVRLSSIVYRDYEEDVRHENDQTYGTLERFLIETKHEARDLEQERRAVKILLALCGVAINEGKDTRDIEAVFKKMLGDPA